MLAAGTVVFPGEEMEEQMVEVLVAYWGEDLEAVPPEERLEEQMVVSI